MSELVPESRMNKRRRNRSSVAIAQLLDSEGFTPKVEHKIAKYHATLVAEAIDKRERYRQGLKEFKEFMRRQSGADQRMVGKHLRHASKMAFDVGLRMGLACAIVTGDRENC